MVYSFGDGYGKEGSRHEMPKHNAMSIIVWIWKKKKNGVILRCSDVMIFLQET